MENEEKTPTMWTQDLLEKYLRIVELAEVDNTLMEEHAQDVIPYTPEEEQGNG